MRIWLVNHYATLPDQASGTRHFSMARHLVRRGHEVTLFRSSVSHNDASSTSLRPWQLHHVEHVDGVEVVHLRTSRYSGNGARRALNMVTFCLALAWVGARRSPRPDVVLGSSAHLFAAAAASRIAALRRVPFVFEVRDLWPLSLVEVAGYHERHPLIRLMQRMEDRLYRTADRVVTVLGNSEPYVLEHGGRAGHVHVIPNGFDADLVPFRPQPVGLAPFTVMYTGSIGLANGMDSLLDVAKHVGEEWAGRRVRFVFVGPGAETDRLVRRCRAEGLANVEFRGPVAKQDMPDVLAEADVFMATMLERDLYRYGISLNKLFDYLAAARPVVFGVRATDNPVPCRAVLTAPPEDSLALAGLVRRLVELPSAELASLGDAGRRHVEAHHSYAVLAVALEEVLAAATGDSQAALRGTTVSAPGGAVPAAAPGGAGRTSG